MQPQKSSYSKKSRNLLSAARCEIPTCLWTLVSCSRLFSRKDIFCFCAALPPVSSESISALCKTKKTQRLEAIKTKRDWMITSGNPAFLFWVRPFLNLNKTIESCRFTFFTLVAKSWTKSFLKLWRVCSSLAFNREGKKKHNYQKRKRNKSSATIKNVNIPVRILFFSPQLYSIFVYLNGLGTVNNTSALVCFNFNHKVNRTISYQTCELTTVSSRPFRSCLACSLLSCITLSNKILINTHITSAVFILC